VRDDAVVRRNWRATVRRFVRTQMRAVAAMKSPDELIRDLLPRMLYVAENRNVMDELEAMTRERWAAFLRGDNRYRRPAARP
jgi:hypothetical protein